MAAPEMRDRLIPSLAGMAMDSPSTVKVGDLVIVWTFERTGAGVPTFTLQSGWTELFNLSHNDGSTDGRFACARIIATANGVATYQPYTTSTGSPIAWCAMNVVRVGTFDAAAIAVGTAVSNTGTGPPDPPSVALNTSRANQVIAGAAWHLTASATNTVTVPTNYSNLTQIAGAATLDIATAERAVGPAVASEDPGAFGDNQTPNGSVAGTIAIPEPLRNTTVTNNADGGTDNTVVTAGNSGGTSGKAFDESSFYGNTVIFDNERSVSGLSYKSVKNSTTASALGWNDWSLSSGGEMFGRMYINLGSLPTLNSYIMNAYNAGTYLAGVRLDTDGELHLYDQNSALLDTSNFTLALDKWYRLEFRLKTAGQEFELRIYEGHSTTALDTLLSTGQDLGAADMNGVVFGWSSGSNFNGTMWFDDVGISNAWMGPSLTSYAKVYDFENGTDEAAVVATDPTGTDNDAEEVDLSGSPSVMVYDTAVAARGGKSARFSNGATSGTARWEWPTTSRRLYVRAYVYLRSGHADTLELIRFAGTSGTRIAAMRVTAARKLVGVDSTAATGTASTTTLSEQTWYRVEACFDYDAQTIEWRLYGGADLHTSTPTETMAPYVASLQTQGTPTQVFFGQATGASSFGPTWMDEIAASNNNWIGPAADLGTPIAGSDSATGSDTTTLAVALTATDSAAGSDTSSLDVGTVSKAGTDSATGSDTAALVVALTATDSASGSDTSNVDTGESVMPTATVKVAATGDTTNATNWNTTSWTPTAERVYYLFATISEVSELETGTFTVTGNGLTWTLVDGTPFDFGTVYSDRIELFRADNTAGSGTAGVTNIATTDGVNHDGIVYCIIEVQDDGGVLESNAVEGSADGASISIASYATNSLVLAGIGKSGNETVAPSGETELSEGTYGTPARVMQVQSGTDTTSTWAAWGTGRAYGAVIAEIGAGGGPPPPTPTLTQSHFRIRSDDTVALNTDSGWAAALDTNATIDAEKIFRVRFEVETPDTFGAKTFKLQYRRNAGTWTDLAKPGGTGPAFTEAYAVEMRDSAMFANDAATTNLLAGSSLTFDAGAGVTDNLTPSITLTNEHTEYEFPLLIRISYGYSSGTIGRNNDGDTFDFRLVESSGAVLGGTYVTPTVTLNIPNKLIGGTIVETPHRVGPFADANGNLYYLCEYSEPAPYKLMLKSTDGGNQWTETDAANAPGVRDLESVDCQVVGHTIHVMHMGLGSTINYSTFNMSSHGSAPDTWVIKDQLVHDNTTNPQDQAASLVVRGDGTVVAAYNTDASGTEQRQGYRIRSAGGTWSAETILDAAGGTADFTDVCMVLGASNKTHIFYQDLTNGILYHRSLTSADVLSARETVATGLSTAGGREHVIIPPVYYDDAGAETIVVGYTKNGDIFYTNSVINDGTPGTEQQVTATALATNIGSSDHAAAFIANDGTTLHAFWADDVTFDLWHTENLDLAGWTSTTEVLDNTTVDLVTGTIFTHNGGNGGAKVAGMVFDGSTGYTGNQQYFEWALPTGVLKNGTDAAAGSETSHVALTSTDSGAGTETSAISLARTESGTGSETAAVSVPIAASDSAVGTDTAALAAALSGTDSGTGSDASSPVAQTKSAAETGTGTDTAALVVALTATEAGAGTDTSSSMAKTVSDSGTGLDTASLVVTLTATETGAGTDTSTLAQPKTASDTGVGTDTVSALTATLSAADAGTGSETGALALARTDSGSGSDASSLAAAASATESGTGSEVSGLGLVGSEAGIGADTSSLAVSLSATETGVGVETSGLLAGDQRSANDSGTATDTAVLAAALTASDAATGSDTSALTQAKTASDSGVGTDTAAVSVPTTASETGTGTDTAVLAVSLVATESGIGSDTSSLLTGFIVNASEVGTGTDTAVLAAALVATDAALGAELAQIGLARTETGTGSETASVTLSGADTGTGTDTSRVGVAGTEAGSGVETSTLAVAVVATDSGIGTESATSAHVGSDSGTGSETSALAAAVSASESGALSQETANVGEGNNKSASDVGTGADTATLVVALSSTETGTGVETSSLGEQTFINVADSGAATETSRISLVAADSGSGTETATPAAALSVSETGAGVDSSLLVAALGRTDAALGTDAALLAAALARSDTGVGTDTSARAVVITALEIGSGTETAALSVVIVATDSALAFDVVMEVDRADASLGSNLEARYDPDVLLDARVVEVRHTGSFRPEVELDGSWGSRRDPGGWMSTSLFGSEYAESHA